MAERFTDDELAFLRHARFGQLPPRVRPEDLVESQETDPVPYVPREHTIEQIAWIGVWTTL